MHNRIEIYMRQKKLQHKVNFWSAKTSITTAPVIRQEPPRKGNHGLNTSKDVRRAVSNAKKNMRNPIIVNFTDAITFQRLCAAIITRLALVTCPAAYQNTSRHQDK